MNETQPTLARISIRQPSRVEQGFVWALAMILLSPALYVLACGLRLVIPSIDFIRILCPFLNPISELLEKSGLQTQNYEIIIVYGHIIPWLIIGFLFGMIWGKPVASKIQWLQKRALIIIATLLVLSYCGYAVFMFLLKS